MGRSPTRRTRPRSSARRSSTPRAARPSASRSGRFSTTSSSWRVRHHGRGHPGVRRRLHHRPRAGRAHRGRCREGQVVECAGPERRARRVRSTLRRVRLHERVPRGRAWRDARVTKIWAGSNEIMKSSSAATWGSSLRSTPRRQQVEPPPQRCFRRHGRPGPDATRLATASLGARHTQTPGERRWAVSFRDELIGGS